MLHVLMVSDAGGLATSRLVVGNTADIATRDGALDALDVKTGQQVWSVHTGSYLPEYDGSDDPNALSAGDGLLILPTPTS